MNIHARFEDDALRRTLLDRLSGIRRPPTAGSHQHADRLFSYCSLERERIAAIRLEFPIIGIVLRGEKEVWLGGRAQSLPAGTVFTLPAGVAMDVVNIPGGPTDTYESLVIEVRALPAGMPSLPPPGTGARAAVRLTRDLVEALGHACTSIADRNAAETLKAIRLAEVLALLRGEPAARHLFQRSVADEINWLVEADPSADWTAERLARRLGMGASTLRRHLAKQGRPLRRLLREARMRIARETLADGASSGEAAELAGYNSRSHFARRFREAYGAPPSGWQANSRETP